METSDNVEQGCSTETVALNEEHVVLEVSKSETPDDGTYREDLSEPAKDVTSDGVNGEEPPQHTPENVDTGGRDSISLQRVASVEEISRAMAKAEKSRPRRKRQESESMQNWKKEFEERLRVKDELETEAIKQLRVQADEEKAQWYEQWKQRVAERKEQNLRDQEEASDHVDGDVWTRMRGIAKSLDSRKNSQDLSRMRALANFLDKLPRNNGVVPQTR